jgi:hypothetical protein
MIDNFVAHLFSHIQVKKHNTTIDEIDHPGIASTVKGCSEYPGLHVYNGKAAISGFRTHSSYKTSKFEALGFLGRLGLGFFNDITVLIYKGNFKILFTRNSDSNVIYSWKGPGNDAALPIKGKITIKTFYLQVPVIECNNEPQNMLIKEMLDNRYIFQFKKWECIPITNVSRASLNTDITNIIRSTTTSPIWAFVVFQTNR